MCLFGIVQCKLKKKNYSGARNFREGYESLLVANISIANQSLISPVYYSLENLHLHCENKSPRTIFPPVDREIMSPRIKFGLQYMYELKQNNLSLEK